MINAFAFARKATEKLYDSKADIFVMEKIDGGSVFAEDKQRPKLIYALEPCRVSQKSIGASESGAVQYETKLIISPDLDIPAGSRVVVTDIHGNVDEYVYSGDPFDSYTSHQEITLSKVSKT